MKREILFGIILSLLVFQPQNAAAKNPKVTICHKGHTITIAESAVNAHLAHGDSEGECTEEQQAEREQGEYHYLYFLSSQVYYDESRALYFFQVDGEWQEAAELPATITVNQQEMVSVSLDVDLPYIEHESILKRYPVPQATTAEYQYQYYPSAQVYYDQTRTLYFYQLDGQWQEGERLPESLTIVAAEAVSLALTAATPYLQHEKILLQYPVPTATPLESEDTEKEKPQKKVTICHKGKNTLLIAESALQAHLDHGDTIGACQNQQKKQENSKQKGNSGKEKPKKSEKQEKGKKK